MSDTYKRTDLALERAETIRTEAPLPEGIAVSTKKTSCFEITDVSVTSDGAAKKIEKPKGRYITLETGSRLDMRPQNFEQCAADLADELRSLMKARGSVLVVGLGNEAITPDSLGPRVISHIFSTRHIKTNAPSLYSSDLGEVCAFAPGVMGQTGIEAGELIKSVCEAVKPSLVVAVDALACSELSHLGKTVQLTDSGISPGSGVLNSRKELSKATLGVPCIAVGVPTIADLGAERQGGEPLMVTPRSVDKLISCSAQLISSALNLALHPGLDLEEIIGLTS